MNTYLLDCNIMDELEKESEFVEQLSKLVNACKMRFIQNNVVWAECEAVKDKYPKKYFNFASIRKNLQIEEVGEETLVLGCSKFPFRLGNGKDYKKHYGEKTSNKKMKDSHIYAATKLHKAILVTKNTADFKDCNDIKIVSYDEFKKLIEENDII